MAAPTHFAETELEFDHGTWDAATFAAQALSGWQPLAAVIDHTLLKAEATREQVENLCDEAARYRFACAMVNPMWAPTAVSVLAGTGIPVGAVIGFPLGASLVSTLRQEAAALTRLGAKELDMVHSRRSSEERKSSGGAARHPRRGGHGAPPRRHAQGDSGNLPPECGRKTARSGDRHSGRRGFPEDLHRLLHPAAQPQPMWPCCAAWPAGAAASRQRRHPHTGRCQEPCSKPAPTASALSASVAIVRELGAE